MASIISPKEKFPSVFLLDKLDDFNGFVVLTLDKGPLEKPCLSGLDVPFSDFDRITPDEASGRGLSFKDFDRGIDFSKPTGPIDLTRSLNFGTLSSSSKSSFKPSKMSFGPDIDPDFFLPILKRLII